MKKTVSILCLAVLIISVFSACTSLPDEPATSSAKKYTIINGMDEIEPSTDKKPTVVDKDEKPDSGSTTIKVDATKRKVRSDIELTISDYYVYNKSYVTIKDVEMTDYGFGVIEGYAKLELTGLGFGEDQVRVGVLYYDDDDNVIKTSFILADIKNGGYKEGDVVDCRFDIHREMNVARMAFVDYAAVADKISI